MPPSSRNTVTAIVLGGAVISALGALLYYYYFVRNSAFNKVGTKTLPQSSDKKSINEPDDENSEWEDEEDEDEEDDDDDEEEDKVVTKGSEDETQKSVPEDPKVLKDQFESACSQFTAFMNAGQYHEAIEKMTEAINLASKLSMNSSSILKLYNNRSAMYERLKQYENSLRDITVVLAMQPDHPKARIRRAKIYDAQGKIQQALEEFVFVTILERMKNENPTNESRITVLSKAIAAERSANFVDAMRLDSKKDLPSKSYIRNYLETHSNFHGWRSTYDGRSRADLVKKLESARKTLQSLENSESPATSAELEEATASVFDITLEMVCFELVHDSFPSAFEFLHSLDSLAATAMKLEKFRSVSLYHELFGTELQLRSNLSNAHLEFEKAISVRAKNISAQLKRVSVLLDLGELKQAEEMYASLLQYWTEQAEKETEKEAAAAAAAAAAAVQDTLQADDETGFSDARSSPPPELEGSDPRDECMSNIAWIYLHRVSLWITRDKVGAYLPNAIDNALADIAMVIEITEPIMHLPSARGAQFAAHLKSVNLRTHAKASMELQSTPEDYACNRVSIQSAKNIFPEHESVALLEAEQLCHEEDLDGAMMMMEKIGRKIRVKRRGQAETEVTFAATKASIITAKAFSDMNTGTHEGMITAQNAFQEVQDIYKTVLEKEPTAIEIMAQFAQLKSLLFGDWDGAVELLRAALPFARSREEVQDICQMLVMNEAHQVAIAELRALQIE